MDLFQSGLLKGVEKAAYGKLGPDAQMFTNLHGAMLGIGGSSYLGMAGGGALLGGAFGGIGGGLSDDGSVLGGAFRGAGAGAIGGAALRYGGAAYAKGAVENGTAVRGAKGAFNNTWAMPASADDIQHPFRPGNIIKNAFDFGG